MNRIMLIFLLSLMLLGGACTLFDNDDDVPDPYTGGEVSGLVFSVEGPQRVRLTWAENFPDEDGFFVDRKVWDGQWQHKIQHVNAGATTALDTTAVLGTVYYYKVYAYKGDRESVSEDTQYNFFLPSPYGLDYDYSWAIPNRMRLFWTNLAPWADSIVVARRFSGEEWVSPLAVLNGDAVSFEDWEYNVQVETTWGLTAYYQEHVSQQALLTMLPPK